MRRMHMRKTMKGIAGLAILLICLAIRQVPADDDETKISLGEVPEPVLAAVMKANAGITITSAERMTDGSRVLYEIEGEVGDSELEFVVSPDGVIVETEGE